jgi:hypothetical protein
MGKCGGHGPPDFAQGGTSVAGGTWTLQDDGPGLFDLLLAPAGAAAEVQTLQLAGDTFSTGRGADRVDWVWID